MNMPENTSSTSARVHRAGARCCAKCLAPAWPHGQDGPPDLDELWRDFKRKLLGRSSALGKKRRRPGASGFQPDTRSAGVGAALIALIVVVVWLFSGSFIVQEGQQAVVTTFGRYSHTVDAGWGWRWPYPIQADETSTSRRRRRWRSAAPACRRRPACATRRC